MTMRSVIPHQLWIGNAFDVRDIAGVLKLGVAAVVDLAANEPAVLYPRDIVYCRFPLHDGLGNDIGLLRLAVHTVVELMRAGLPTVVACSAGMSRSPAIVAAAVSVFEVRPADEVLLRITQGVPHDVSPVLWNDIRKILGPASK